MSKTSPVRGTQDCLNLKAKKSIKNLLNKKFLLSNFLPIETPIIENLELFVRCVGETSDVVGKEMFVIETASEEKICLRPEATASTFRAFLDSDIQSGPWKVFSCGPMFRHERPQKGRWRQFDQFNIEIIDTKNIEHDVMLIELLDRIFRRDFNLQAYVLHLNFLGTSAERAAHRAELVKFLVTQKKLLCQNCIKRTEINPLRCFDCKNEQCRQVLVKAPLLANFFTAESSAEWQQIQRQLILLGVNFIQDSTLVRGLDYYSGVVFEFKSNILGAQDTFCGGGRYDLSEAFDLKKNVPSVGAAVGIGRLQLILEELKLLPEAREIPLHLILPMSKDEQMLAMLLHGHLVQAGLRSDVLVENCSFAGMMKKANRTGAQKVLILGATEVETNSVAVKDMLTGQQQSVSQAELIKFLAN